jgi:hypothetical protein
MTSIQIDIKDGLSSSVAVKGPCIVATTANITLSGEQTIDGVAVVTDDRVLVKDQTTGADNGIYVVDTGSWRRAKDFSKSKDIKTGTMVNVVSGSAGAGQWQVSTTGDITVGTTSIAFTQVVQPYAGLPMPAVASTFLQRNSGNTAYVAKTVPEVRDALDTAPYVASLASLKALDTTKDTSARYDGSAWDFLSGDYSTQVAADTTGALYAKADAIASTVGAWKRRYVGRADMAWWLGTGTSLTAPLAAALAMGVPLWLGAGNYTTSNVAFPSNANLLMDRNAVIAPTGGFISGDVFTASGKDNIWIQGGQFNAPYATYTGIAYIRPTNCSRVTVKDVKVISVGTHGILMDGCTQSLIEDCEVLEAGLIGILLNSSSATSTANRVVRCRSLNSYGSHGIQLAGGAYNVAEDCYSFGARHFGLSLYQESYSRAVNCTSRRSYAEGFNHDSCYRSTFINCTADWDGVGGYASTDFGMSINGDTVDTSYNSIIGCKVKGCAKSGIAIAGATNAQFNLIAENTITNVNSLAEANKAGILIYGGGAVNNHVVGNQINGDANMHYGVRDESTGRNVFGQNNIMNPATGNYSLNSSSVTVIETTGSSKVTTGTSGHAVPFLDGANTWSSAQTVSLSATGTALTLYTADPGAAGVDLNIYQDSASPAANDIIGRHVWTGRDSAANFQVYGYIQGIINDPTSTSEDFSFQWVTMQAGSFVVAATLGLGYQLGSPTGGDKGTGTLNAAVGYYVNNVKLADSAGVYLGNGGVVNFNSGNYTITHSAGNLSFNGSADFTGAVLPTVSGTPSLGSATKMWANLFLKSGAVINFNNGDYTVTHSSGQLAFSGTVLSANGVGYGPAGSGIGGTVTQATSKSTGVTLNTMSGEITLNGAALAASTTVAFTFTNSKIAATDQIILNHVAVGTFGSYTFNARPGSGAAGIDVRNVSLGSLSEAIVIRFTIIKSVNS